ncbi:major facilitator superfamily permease [Secundilactobacillus odoratitofui DSM 19909 = JCM 15043]|uniref:Major facilitator superfamily permease n=1 Tax=Secundilactobacillus odoratitofui DSM 19909 = JCM 15043 TaxID=1423776 RepID=A0A0R1M0V6_9LACO|nr:SLC45 family MFS transporter [Secundilactobacillus odoratitofui]KRK98849.1 major facilitator superfamily permease [Secundilactobacillus odoratitofui DSM 19909 = JCM 15043]
MSESASASATPTAETPKKDLLPTLPSSTIFLINFGFLGVQMAFQLQSTNMGRIFQTIGADPNSLGWFFILPPLAGMIVQPLVGYFSDRTWMPKLGRRIPYLLIGAVIAMIVMMLLPNAGSFGFGFGSLAALWFGAIALLFMDLSSNIAMQPFKMMVGDMVNEKQKGFAYSIQSFSSNAGALLASVFPFLLTAVGIANTAEKGKVPNSVVWSFYAGAIILLLCCLLTVFRVKEYDPVTYAKYHGIDENEEHKGLWQALKSAPKVFWTVSIVQFFCWMGFQYLWTYATGAIAANVWHASDPSSAGYQAAGNWFGVLSAVQSIAAVIWALVLSRINNNHHKAYYSASLLMGAVGFGSIFFIHDKYTLVVSFALIGCAWAAMNAFPFTFLTNAITDSANMGTYLGLFNSSICLPQIVASLASFALFPLLGSHMPSMLLLSGIFLALGAASVGIVKEVWARKA